MKENKDLDYETDGILFSIRSFYVKYNVSLKFLSCTNIKGTFMHLQNYLLSDYTFYEERFIYYSSPF